VFLLVVNSVVVVMFMVVVREYIDLVVVVLVVVGLFVGGLFGARFGCWLLLNVLWVFIVVVGIVAIAWVMSS